MSEELAVGQVWEWSIGDDPYNICETYLLLRKCEHHGFPAFMPQDPAWEALNLETGQLELVTPFFTAGNWEQLGV